ncbi:MAG: DNA-repair protein [Ardenticatenaceae bacterium]|nr:MAG: DNA-repair protein [Ardenticatenaceae bacterium]
MSLTTLDLPIAIDTSSHNIVQDFYKPALSAAVQYDRGVGFFSSGWLRQVAQGMATFAQNGGKARLITSPILAKKDLEALMQGEQAKRNPILRAALLKNVGKLQKTLEADTFSALAWMIADEIMTLKLAVPTNHLTGDFHDKFGVFTDADGHQVSFSGSPNESIQGTQNYESIKIFKSWEPAFAPLVEADAHRFERLWHNGDPNVRVYDLPEAVREKILQLRVGKRPYTPPPWLKEKTVREEAAMYQPVQPHLPPHLHLRDYQEQAIAAWFAHDCRGLLEMATGTGKTITALAASVALFERAQRLAVVISVPYQHLVDQWQEEAAAFGYRPILAYQNKKKWLDRLNHEILEFNGRYRPFISVITTHTTFIDPDFQATLARLQTPALLIADEVHHLGAERSRQNYPQNIPYRLALSATPDRWFDVAGTAALRRYFGKTVFAFPLEQAIGVSLTPYYYYPHLVELTEEELEKYQELSAKIGRVFHMDDADTPRIVAALLRQRADLLNNAENKLVALSQLIKQPAEIKHTLFYTAPGQIQAALRLLGVEKGLLVHRFTAQEPNRQRQTLLADFANEALQGLVAMKCLDEGVDVPHTKTAYFLASSGNPREFIQRRGRILRHAPGKEYAIIHDLIAIPPVVSRNSKTYRTERMILKRELQRFKEFANPAQNKQQAIEVIWELATHYGLRDF